MEINKIKKAAEIAKARTSDKRWVAAIDRAVEGVESGKWIVTELAHGIAVTTESGETYFANGVCGCKAFSNGQACKHRALARLIEIAATIEETAPEAVSPAEVVATKGATRTDIIADIKARWPRDINLADELMARFRRNSLEMLSVDFLIAIQATL